MKYYTVTMSNGDVYGIPASVIAHNYAEYYAGKGEDYEENYNDMVDWFDSGDFAFADWAKNNMNWNEVEDFATLLESKQNVPDLQDGWVNGPYEYKTIEEANHGNS